VTPISVGIPTCNPGRYLTPALDSVLSQVGVDLDVWIVDDASEEALAPLVQATADPRLHFHRNGRRLGLPANWNRCLEFASSPYVIIFHQDDVLLPGGLAAEAEILDQNAGVGMVFSDIEVVDPAGCVVGGHWSRALPKEDTIFEGRSFISLMLGEANLVPCPTVLARTEVYHRMGVFDTRLGYAPDFEMWLRIATEWDVAYRTRPTVQLRRHIGQESRHYMGRPAEIDEMSHAVHIFFQGRGSHVPGAALLYDRAIAHLTEWSGRMARDALRRLAPVLAISIARRWFILRRMRRAGLAALTAG
jgi:hypothetical protein